MMSGADAAGFRAEGRGRTRAESRQRSDDKARGEDKRSMGTHDGVRVAVGTRLMEQWEERCQNEHEDGGGEGDQCCA
jgi:hypothetical protein